MSVRLQIYRLSTQERLNRSIVRYVNAIAGEYAEALRHVAPRDTGFLADTIAVQEIGSTGIPAKTEVRMNKHGRFVRRTHGAIPPPPPYTATVILPAPYAVYVDRRINFIGPIVGDRILKREDFI